MCWKFFKKIKDGLTTVFNCVKDKVVKPVINKVAPVITTAIGAAKVNPEIGTMVGSAVQNVGNALDIKKYFKIFKNDRRHKIHW